MVGSSAQGLFGGHVSIVTALFPSPHFPERGAFNASLAREFAAQGLRVDVVACTGVPRRLWESLRGEAVEAWDFSMLRVNSPTYLSLGRWFPLTARYRRKVSQLSMRRAIEPVLAQVRSNDGVVYAVFSDSALGCLRWCKRTGTPLFLELPESGMEAVLDAFGADVLRTLLRQCHGIVADSLDNRQFCVNLAPDCAEKVIYLPNAADLRRFSPTDRLAARRKLGLPERERIGVFCGHFIERKGPLRVLEALRLAGSAKGVFLGRGPQIPTGPSVLHAGPVANSELPHWMNAGDFFILPSHAEGLANVIVEAMACGLPLIVSDRSFNRNFLTGESAIFVDPNSPHDMANAINRLDKDDELRRKMSESVLAQSRNFSMQGKVEHIRAFIHRHTDTSLRVPNTNEAE